MIDLDHDTPTEWVALWECLERLDGLRDSERSALTAQPGILDF